MSPLKGKTEILMGSVYFSGQFLKSFYFYPLIDYFQFKTDNLRVVNSMKLGQLECNFAITVQIEICSTKTVTVR